MTTLFIVPWPCAGRLAREPAVAGWAATAWARAVSTVSAIRWEVSTLPATTAEGRRASTSDPGSVSTVSGA